jgi:hypothetical protein
MEQFMKSTITMLAGVLALTSYSAFAGFSLNKLIDGDGLPTLTSSVTKRVGFTKAAVPYTNSVEYFGYIDKDSKPDAKVNGKDTYYLYVWVPGALDELGVRMISPVGDLAKPEKGNFVQNNYVEKHKADSNKWFDTWLRVERMNVLTPDKIKGASKSIQVLGTDDDGDDTYEEKRHSKYNSLVRIKSELGSPTKALVRGLYRIAFTTYKKGEVEGSFVATVGANIPGVKMATSLDELHKIVNM